MCRVHEMAKRGSDASVVAFANEPSCGFGGADSDHSKFGGSRDDSSKRQLPRREHPTPLRGRIRHRIRCLGTGAQQRTGNTKTV